MAGWQRLEETLNSNCDRAESDLEQQLAVVKIERDGLAAIVKELQAANAKLRKCVELYADEKNWAVTGELARIMNLWVGKALDGPEPAQECLKEGG